MLRSEYGGKLKIYEGEDEYVEFKETDWYKEIKTKSTPGDAMRIYRDNQQLTQVQLGEKLGEAPLGCKVKFLSLTVRCKRQKIAEQFNTPDRKGQRFSDPAKSGVIYCLSKFPVTLRPVIMTLGRIYCSLCFVIL